MELCVQLWYNIRESSKCRLTIGCLQTDLLDGIDIGRKPATERTRSVHEGCTAYLQNGIILVLNN